MNIRYSRIPPGTIRVPLPDASQDEDSTCGASCLLSICIYFGVGPVEERRIVKDMGMDLDVGSHPFQVVRAARKYGLEVREQQPMTIEGLLGFLEDEKPVMCMIQAWPKTKRKRFKDVWDEGHWVAAVGWHGDRIYFEDPVFTGAYGFLSFDEMEDRWHDVGPHGRHVPHYGVALWRPGVKPLGREIRLARKIA